MKMASIVKSPFTRVALVFIKLILVVEVYPYRLACADVGAMPKSFGGVNKGRMFPLLE